MATSTDPSKTIIEKLRIYEAKLKIYNELNKALRELRTSQLMYGDSVYTDYGAQVKQWKAPLVAIHALTDDITKLLKTTELALRKSQVTQFTAKFNDFMSRKGLDNDQQSTWYMIFRHGECHLEWSDRERDLRFNRRHALNEADWTQEDRNVPVYTTFMYQNETCQIEATLEALQQDLNTYTSTDTTDGTRVGIVPPTIDQTSLARMKSLLGRLKDYDR
jgi:hypothetical protein